MHNPRKEPRILLTLLGSTTLIYLTYLRFISLLFLSIYEMASATGIPQQNPATSDRGEDEPLLGRVGDASQPEGKGIQFNLFIGVFSLIHTAFMEWGIVVVDIHGVLTDTLCHRHRYYCSGRRLDCKPLSAVTTAIADFASLLL